MNRRGAHCERDAKDDDGLSAGRKVQKRAEAVERTLEGVFCPTKNWSNKQKREKETSLGARREMDKKADT